MNWKYILIVFILAAVVGGGILAYQFLWLPKEEVKIPEVKPSEEITRNETANWEIYRNEEFRFELRYPQDWKMQERGDGYAFAKTFYIEKITKDPRYIFPPDIVINPTEGSEPDSCYLSFINTQKKEIELAGRKATAWLFLTEEGDVWRLIIKNIPDLPENWNKDTAIHVSYPVYPEKGKNCEYADQFVYCPIHLESIKVFCAVDKKESEFFNQILSTFKFIEEDETIDWKTYRNEEYGFEIKYPNNWRFESDLLNNKISITGETLSPTLIIQFPTEKYSEILAKEERNFNEWQQESVEQPSGKINDITFAETSAKEFLYYSPVGFIEQVIILSKSNQTIVIKSFKNSALDPILSTFKFIK